MTPIISGFLSVLHMNGQCGLICHSFGAMSGSEQVCTTWQCGFGGCHGSSSCEKRKPTSREYQKPVEILGGVMHSL